MRIFEIKDGSYSSEREYASIRRCARAVITDKGKILTEETDVPRILMLPGGKLEDCESVKECIIRECAEECGLVVEPEEELFAIREYYKDIIFYSVYVKCRVKGECTKALTDNEKKLGLNCVWHNIGDAEEIAAKLENSYTSGSELEGMLRRERTALGVIKDIYKKQSYAIK